ncbi:MAG TPA: ribosome biogenesis GTPase Der, partial [Spirochaetaceae bacterium]|nr:ribosome biogenesis GTPase Der [Spirochaetaceae bacterium]
DASAILFMLDFKGVNAQDDELLEGFRKYADKLVLVVNKVDDPSHDNAAWNFHSYGYKRVCAISASHARGLGDLEDAVCGILKEKGLAADSFDRRDEECSPSDGERMAGGDKEGELDLDDLDGIQRRLASVKTDDRHIVISIMGKPNTGKSTLSNLFLGEDKSIVSDIAGTTRDIVRGDFEYKGVLFSVCDTAGIRRKSKVNEDIEYYSVNRAIRNIGESDVVLLVIDCQEGITDQDKKIASLIIERGAGVVLVLNKVDLLEKQSQFNAVSDRLRFLFPQLSFAPVVGISALKHKGVTKLLDTIIGIKRQLDTKVPTSSLNSALEQWNRSFSPPRNGNVWYKVLYATQVSISPVRFLFIVNRKKGFPESYVSYVKNKMRKHFKMDSIPVSVVLRERERKDRSQTIFSSSEESRPKSERKKNGFSR